MTFINETTSREDLEVIIFNERSLYDMFDETKFLADGYSSDEMRAIITAWIEAGDECAAA
jgi:hypothetical protein